MLQKIFRTKLWKGFCCVLLAGVIYYFMTDGFSQTVGQTARGGKKMLRQWELPGAFRLNMWSSECWQSGVC